MLTVLFVMSKKHEINYKMILESIPGLFLVVRSDDPKFTIVSVSKPYLLQISKKLKDVVGSGLSRFFSDNLVDSMRRVIQTRAPDILASQINSPVFDSNGNLKYIIHRFEDSRQLKQLAESLQETERFLNESQEISKIGSYTTDLKTGVWKISNEMYTILGIEKPYPHTLNGFVDFIHPDSMNDFISYHFKVETEKLPFDLEYKIIRFNDRSVRWVHGLGEIQYDDDKNPIKRIGTIQDITERKKMEHALMEAKEFAEETARLKTRFLDTAAHELRTPVTTFSVLLQFMERQLKQGHNIDASLVGRLRKQADRISNLVSDLFDVSLIEHGQIALNFESTNLKVLVSECVDNFRVQHPNRTFIFKCPMDVIMLEVDQKRIAQVLSNIIDNAVKYTDETRPIEVNVELKPKVLRISVIDHGVGISSSVQKNLFEPLLRGSDDTIERPHGLGLGLNISRAIVNLHGGRLSYETKEGIGSTFYFELPMDRQVRKAA